ncbi:MAG: hypothetical protein VBE63_14340 [Lamprobacter sp.]|uniref:hypothetical protein n=1 Tax=Lamprobacter sp. TaxID=3100796 RepID=UPI002B262D66|nr:hypothetical protein [Lamprobacter sp.]MEA3641103.1 hypothetical protein [Lamprobacter sp.]
MKSRIAVTLLSSALVLGATGHASAAEAASSQALLPVTKAALTEGLSQGDLEKRLSAALETAPSQEQLLQLRQSLGALAATSPADAAAASQALVNSAWTAAVNEPQLGVVLAAIAVDTLTTPGVAAAAPTATAQALADVHGAVAMAQQAADSREMTLTGTEVTEQARSFATTDTAIITAVADFNSLAADAVELAEAQAALTNFSTASFSFGIPPGFFNRPRPVASPANGFNVPAGPPFFVFGFR